MMAFVRPLALVAGLAGLTAIIASGLLALIERDAAAVAPDPARVETVRVRACRCSQPGIAAAVDIVEPLVRRHLKRLTGFDICVAFFNSPTAFLGTTASTETDPRRRTYRLYLRRFLLEDPALSREALEAILVHELFHVEDLANRTPESLNHLWQSYASNPRYACDYELLTDWKTLDKGFGKGLAEYRRWMYPAFARENADGDVENVLRIKRERYYQPEEIAAFLKGDRRLLSSRDRACR